MNYPLLFHSFILTFSTHYSFSLMYDNILIKNRNIILKKWTQNAHRYEGKMWQTNAQKWPLYCNITDSSSKADSSWTENELDKISEEHYMCYVSICVHAQMCCKLDVIAAWGSVVWPIILLWPEMSTYYSSIILHSFCHLLYFSIIHQDLVPYPCRLDEYVCVICAHYLVICD